MVNENTIRDYQKAKYAGKKGQYQKAHLMFSSRRITSVKMMESNSKRSFIKANILKSYTGSISRHVTIMFVGNTPTQAYYQKWHLKGPACNRTIKSASQIKLKYLRNLIGARRDIKKKKERRKQL